MVVTFDESTAMDYVQKNNLVFHTYTLPINCERIIRGIQYKVTQTCWLAAGCWLLSSRLATLLRC